MLIVLFTATARVILSDTSSVHEPQMGQLALNYSTLNTIDVTEQ